MDKYVVRTASRDSQSENTKPPSRYPPAKNLKGAVGKTRSSYYAMRNEKIAKQAPAATSELLKGCTFYFTNCHSQSQLKLTQQIWLHGGSVVGGWSRKSVTHVLSDGLCGSKLEKEVKSVGCANARSCAVVRPTWLLDTLEAQKKQTVSASKYQIVPSVAKNIATFLLDVPEFS
jgi:BRCA1 C Terminus (BRCT) domain